MQDDFIYLDNSATTRPTSAVKAAVAEAEESLWFNPSALYRPSMETQKKVEAVRASVLHAVGGDGQKLVFTSCGTEADNLAVLGHLRTRRSHGRVLIFAGEHPAIRECAAEIRKMGFTVEDILPGKDGVIPLERLEEQLGDDVEMIIVMQVNNETGAIQPLEEIARLRDRICPRAAIHVDGVQGFLRVPVDFNRLGIQSYALSGHKVHALKGIGALVFQKSHKLTAIGYGGGQEGGLRSGTENTAGIFSLGAAVADFPADGTARMMERKSQLVRGLSGAVPDMRLNGPALDSAGCSPHILNVSFPPVRSQTMLFALEADGIYVSAGSACGSHKQKVSQTLLAMGLTPQLADCALRFSLCPSVTEEQIRRTVERVQYHYQKLSPYVRR